ncbi:glycoside hydrolase/deacetylase [Artomyces pyxidatus]|uniref:Glycoside hydrolase/deacetylase n=1 Tax=Artomyces pyxidatus TaxID=48021 RepID=A0ACB8THU3_9AGAM|nr:glycoside hydrolase/deacetylase [Artomyces pyxidatus]
MKSALIVASLPLLALAHGPNPHQHARRQNLAASAPASSPAASSHASSAASGSPASSAAASSAAVPPAGSTSLFPTPTGALPSVSLASTNPTALPLASIVVNAPSAATQAMPTPQPAGAKPSAISNAPGLPDISTLLPSNYPALDKPPPTDSPQVLQWIQDVQNSGVKIPTFAPTVAGGCPANPAAVADQTRCWWTCGGCTRQTDVTTCPDKYTWGLTYDDGPAPYTPDLLSYLDQANLKSTFFVVGSRAISYPALLQQEYMGGHQIAVHTWSHPSLTTLTNEEIIAELGWSKKIIKDVLGVTPTMMRPPFGDIDDRVRAISQAMDLTPVIWTRISPMATFDTDDFNIHGGVTSVQQVLANWEDILGNVSTINTGFIVLEHDLFQQSVEVATGYILPDALAHQPAFRIEPVVSCLNLPMGDAYIETNNNGTNPLPLSGASY